MGPENVAAFVGEPVQGAGGVIIPPAGYWPRVEAICRKYGILMACDEVICGFGRLGSWFGFQHFGVTPDLVTMAKGLSSGYLPISAVGVADHVVEALVAAGGDFVHGYTYSGHPTCAARRPEEHRDHGARAGDPDPLTSRGPIWRRPCLASPNTRWWARPAVLVS